MSAQKKAQLELDKLKAEITALQAEREAVEVRLREAHGKAYAIEREMRRSEKPTPKMKDALLQLSIGAVLKYSRLWNGGYWLDNDGKTESMRESVFYGLRNREAIERTAVEGSVEVYSITEHGKSFLPPQQQPSSLAEGGQTT